MNPRLFLSPPHLGGEELPLVEAAFASNYIAPLGPMVDAFEREFAEYTGIPYCLALSSGTAAMHLALRELGIGPGDLVLASTLTFIGSVTPVTFQGATLAFLDAHPNTWNLDPALLAEELAACARRKQLPKAVIPTDLYGQCCDLPTLQFICAPYNIPVISDAAEAMGARYFPSPHALAPALTPAPSLVAQASSPVIVGQRVPPAPPSPAIPSATLPPSASGIRHLPPSHLRPSPNLRGGCTTPVSPPAPLSSASTATKSSPPPAAACWPATTRTSSPMPANSPSKPAIPPPTTSTEIGYNYRLSNVLAAIGRGQLRVLDQRVERKRQIFAAYQQLLGDLSGLTFMPEAPTGRCNRWLTVILIDPAQFGATTDQVRLALEADNIEARPVWKPMHLQPVFEGCHIRGGPVSEHLFAHGLCLPSGTAIIRRCRR